jgi:hypothetical protein
MIGSEQIQALLPLLNDATNRVVVVTERIAMENQCKIFSSPGNSLKLILSTSFNCSIDVSKEKDRFSLDVNFGIVKFMHEIGRVFSTRVSVMQGGEQTLIEGDHAQQRIPISVTAQAAKHLLECFWNEVLPDDRQIANIELSDKDLMFYRMVVPTALRFVIAHEFAHMLIQLIPSFSKYQEEADRLASDLLKEAVGLGDIARTRRILAWSHELAADRLGFQLALMATREEVEDKELQAAWQDFQWFGTEFFLCVCDMLWRYRISTRDRSLDFIGSHPPFHTRLQLIRREYGAPQRMIDLGAGLQQIVELILTEICKEVSTVEALGTKDVDEQGAFQLLQRAKLMVGKSGGNIEAKRYAEAALSIYERHNNLAGLADCYSVLSAFYKNMGDTLTATAFQARSVMALALTHGNGIEIAAPELLELVNSQPRDIREQFATAVFTSALEIAGKWASAKKEPVGDQHEDNS